MKFYARSLGAALTSPVSRNKVRLLFGARQVGKTMLLRHLAGAATAHVVDLGVAATRRRFEADPDAFRREALALPRRIATVVVDEVQKVPALLDEVQALFDESPRRHQFFLTGSSARRLRRHSANLLPGRCHVFRLAPVCAWESVCGEPVDWPGALPPAAPGPAPAPPFPRQGLERTLLYGSLPGVRAEAPATAAATLHAYVENFLEEEVRREALVRDLGAFSGFLRLAALESGRQLNLTKLSQESGVPASTLKTHYQVLEETFAGGFVRPYARRARRRLLVTPRFLFFDVGVRNAAAGLPFDAGLLAVEGPALLEQWVGQELRARAAILGRGHEVSFWRTAGGAEVDWVWESPALDVPVEVKWTTRPAPGDARHLHAFLDEHPDRARQGLLVCRCPEPQRLSERVLAVPWDRF
ncbi:MAG: ATP-binding protein [Deltaproteobacteria bacterium]|nr:ATP-binding protein [Deltaproteobacteria bacterium]